VVDLWPFPLHAIALKLLTWLSNHNKIAISHTDLSFAMQEKDGRNVIQFFCFFLGAGFLFRR
jgi:hypothetical protein